MILFLHDVNTRIGFWRAWKPLGKAGWPRAYLWSCGCCGLSYDGNLIGLVACQEHVFEIERVVSMPLPQADLYSIQRLCRDAFRHLEMSMVSPLEDEVQAAQAAIACIEAAKGKSDG